MKRICILLIMAGLTALGANAQTVTGSGTPNKIPKFTGSSTIGDSNIFQSPGGSVGIGLTTPTDQFEVHSDSVVVPTNRFGPAAIFTEATGNVTGTAGIRAHATSSSGNTFGVDANAFSPNGTGVIGQGGQNGVVGATSSTDTFAVGVFGISHATTGGGSVAVFGQAWSPGATAGLFANVAGGDIIVGAVNQPVVPVFRVDGHGTVFADGGFRPFGADFAESVEVKGSADHYAPGDLLVIDPSGDRRLSLSQAPYSTLVAGIYSTQPGVVASTHRVSEALPNNEVPLAVVGIVPCKVTAENGSIASGDLLVTSSTPGHAMKGTDRGRMLGAVVGKALEPLQKGTGVIQVLVTLQ
jgi:hypothetical protein